MYAPTTNSGEPRGGENVLPITRVAEGRWSGRVSPPESGEPISPEPCDDEEIAERGLDQPGARLLLAYGDERVRRALTRLMEGEGYAVTEADDPAGVAGAIECECPDVVLLDLELAGLEPSAVVAAARNASRSARLIVVCEGGLAQARKLGAFEVLTKPLATEDLLRAVARAAQTGGSGSAPVPTAIRRRIVGETPVMERLFTSIARVAPLRTTVLITGETGTGKELVARAIHDLSDRAGKPFVPVHCAALPETLLESELFGHVRGSFTGALSSREGLLEAANGGTVFLDEISTLPPSTQVKLLRVLQERTIQRIGSNKPVQLDFRLVAACNVDLAAEVRAGRFREDLYYRIQVYPLHVPALRERKADIPLLVEHFRRRFAEANGVEAPEPTPESVLRLMDYDWPGNVRELENFVERTLVTHLGARSARFEPPAGEPAAQIDLMQQATREAWDLARLEREYILRTLEELHGRRGDTAERLGLDRRTLGRKLSAYWRGSAGSAEAGPRLDPVVRRKPRGVRRHAALAAAHVA